MMKPFNGNAPLAWISAFGFLFAVSWSHFSEAELPLMGLRNLTVPIIGWPLSVVTLSMALFLSFPSILSRERLLILAGFSLCLYLVVTVYVSPVAPLLLLFIGVNIIRESRQPNLAFKRDAEKRGAP
jgi:hypothetical protein